MRVRTVWRGEELKEKFRQAAKVGIDDVMASCTIDAKSDHPGWQNRTGNAEGSIKIVEPARDRGQEVVGEWGSADVDYMIWLELKHGSALRNAADNNYHTLAGRIAQQLGQVV